MLLGQPVFTGRSAVPEIHSSTGMLAAQLVDVRGLPRVDGAARVGEQVGIPGRGVDLSVRGNGMSRNGSDQRLAAGEPSNRLMRRGVEIARHLHRDPRARCQLARPAHQQLGVFGHPLQGRVAHHHVGVGLRFHARTSPTCASTPRSRGGLHHLRRAVPRLDRPRRASAAPGWR